MTDGKMDKQSDRVAIG